MGHGLGRLAVVAVTKSLVIQYVYRRFCDADDFLFFVCLESCHDEVFDEGAAFFSAADVFEFSK